MKTPIDLAEYHEGLNAVPMPEKHYPMLHLNGEKELSFPEEGTMVVRFKRESQGKTERDGKTRYDAAICVKEILSVQSEAKESKEEERAEDALDRLRDEITKKY